MSQSSMLHAQEEAFLREFFKGRANENVVECGCWLGASTRAIAESSDPTTTVYSFDKFKWTAYMNRPYRGRTSYRHGDDFYPEFWRNCEDLITTGRVVPNAVDFCDVHAHVRLPEHFDVAFVDGFKTWHTLPALFAQTVFCHVNQYVIDQDFFWGIPHYWYMHFLMYRLREYFEFVSTVQSLVVWRKIKAITPAAYQSAVCQGVHTQTPQEVVRVYNWMSKLKGIH